ncbi:MAG: ATP-binding protein [Bacteroidota bacterium]
MLPRVAIFLFIYFSISYHLGAQGFEINNFGPNNYRASPNNYYGLETNNGFWYFANENGVLQYDGSRWELFAIDNYSSVHSLAQSPADSTRIYVGGNNEFGYLDLDARSGLYRYHSLRTASMGQLSEIWNIIIVGTNIFFECQEKILKYDGRKVEVYDESNNAYLFPIKDKLFASVYGQGLAQVKQEGMQFVNTDFSFDEDAVFRSLPLLGELNPEGGQLLITSFNGLHIYNESTFEVTPWTTEIDDLLKNDGVADALVWRDSLYAVITLSSGLIFLDDEGRVQTALSEDAPTSAATDQIRTPFDEIDPKIKGLIKEENGLPSNQLRSIFQDIRGNLWICSLYGISHLTWENSFVAADFNPKTVITKSLLNTSDTISSRSIVFEFATPGYDRSELQYSFYLEGLEESWLGWTDQIDKEYTNLDGGIYKFHLKSRLPDGKVTPAVVYTFSVSTLWYKNIWTYLFGASTLSVLIFFGVRFRTVRLKKLNRRLEAIIENRTKELVIQREQLEVANEELIITNTELDNFVYRSSHDLVAPLKSIRGLVNVAKKDNPPDNQLAYLSMMEQSVLKLEDFIKSIMEYSTNAKKEINLSQVSLSSIVDEVMQELRFYDNIERIELIKDFEVHQLLESDAERLKIIMSNLITNGIKYHNYQQEEPTITVSLKKDKDHYTIKVADNGHGIEPQYRGKIFEMFFRASNDSEGSGLGLYIVKDTVNKLKGQISVSSELGVGSTFKVTLPRPK